MKFVDAIIKIGLAIAAVAGIVFLVVKYMDAIKAWAEKLCPKCHLEEDFVEDVAEEPAEEVAPEASVEEVIVEEGTPVAEENDFAE